MVSTPNSRNWIQLDLRPTAPTGSDFLRPMNKQTVCKVELFDQTPAATGGEPPSYVVLVHFSEVAFKIMKAKGQKADLEARKNARNLTKNEWPNIARSGSRITHPTVDLDTLGEPTADPDGAGSRVWVVSAPDGSVYRTAV